MSFPDNKIELYKHTENTRENAVKYAIMLLAIFSLGQAKKIIDRIPLFLVVLT